MHGSELALKVWFWAAMATHSNGISAFQLWRQLGSYKTAWLLCAKLRRTMVNPKRTPLSGLVEIDETTMHHRTNDVPTAGGRCHDGKMLIAVRGKYSAECFPSSGLSLGLEW